MKPFSKETAHLHPDVVKKFWANVSASENVVDCWEWAGRFWNGSREGNEWKPPRFEVQKNKIRTRFLAHRFMWAIVNGYPEELEIRRTCNNCKCVNPDHLAAGTRTDTIEDMKKRGTTQTGNQNNRKLDHAGIYADHVAGMSYNEIMKNHNIESKGIISYIINKSMEAEEWK